MLCDFKKSLAGHTLFLVWNKFGLMAHAFLFTGEIRFSVAIS
jgi:hypothetical protein